MIKQILKKSFLIIIGLLLSLLFLETAMWMGGFALSSYQTYKNNQTLKNKSQYVVMCLGESTTDSQYPNQLQKTLNSSHPGKFSVIDCGMTSARLHNIYQSLDGNINKYNPDIAICMMGVNNGFLQKFQNQIIPETEQYLFYKKIKLCKLYLLIKKHIAYSIKSKAVLEKNISGAKEKSDKLMMQAKIYNKKNDYTKVSEILFEILKLDPDNKIIYSSFLNNKELAEKTAAAARKIKSYHGELYYRILINYNILQGNFRDIQSLIDAMVNEKNFIISSVFYNRIEHLLNETQKQLLFQKTVSKYQVIENIMTFQEKEIFFKRVISEDMDIACGARGIYYLLNKDYKQADEYFDDAEKLRINFPNEQTNKLYRDIIKKLVENNIKVICMQYPVRSIKPLKYILKDTPYYDKITFVSNEKTFKHVLKEKKYDEVFCDNFAGDFGHCVNYGNSLIAANIAKTLTDLTKND